MRNNDADVYMQGRLLVRQNLYPVQIHTKTSRVIVVNDDSLFVFCDCLCLLWLHSEYIMCRKAVME